MQLEVGDTPPSNAVFGRVDDLGLGAVAETSSSILACGGQSTGGIARVRVLSPRWGSGSTTGQKSIHDFTEWGRNNGASPTSRRSFRRWSGYMRTLRIATNGPERGIVDSAPRAHLDKSCAAVEISDYVALKPHRRSRHTWRGESDLLRGR